MVKRLVSLSALAFALLVLGSVWGAGSTDQSSVEKIVFTNGVVYDGKDVPVLYQPLVEAIEKAASSKATFSVREGGTLLVGLNPDSAAEEVVLSIALQSDCPVNSQFRFQNNNFAIEEMVKPTLVAWTKLRHPGLKEASVKSYSQDEGRAEVVLTE